MKILPGILALVVATGLTSVRACDLCGCYTPQLNAMPQMNYTLLPWARGWYGAVGEQFTRFGSLQFDGEEVANPTGQYLNSSITQIVVGYEINSRFALQINMPLIYREFERPEGFEIQQGTVSGLGDISLLLKTVVFHYASPAQRSFEFYGNKNPVAVEHEPDFTASAVLLTGIKFPTGDSSRLKEEFQEIEIEGAPESGIHGHDLTLGTGSYDGLFGEQNALRYKIYFSKQTSNSRRVATARINITLPTISSGAVARDITSFVIAIRFLGSSAWLPAKTKMSIDSGANQRKTPGLRQFFSVLVWWDRAAVGARNSPRTSRF
jgi:hypothetical protein